MNETCWSTVGVPRSNLREFWLGAVGSAINEVDIRIEDTENFRASLRQRKLGPLVLSHIDVHGTQIVRRTRSIISRCNAEQFSVVHLLAGQGLLRHCGREVPFGEGQCAIVDSREPYDIAIVGRGESLSMHMPAAWVTERVQDMRSAVAMPLPRSHPWAARLMDLMRTAHAASTEETAANLFAQHFGTTVALAVGGITGELEPTARNGFQALQRTLAELASAPNLRAEEVASLHQVSARQLHYVFAAHGTTFRSELTRLRLRRAHDMLVDGRFRTVPIEEIARRCGFADARHFRRRFNQHFGFSPGALRQ